MQEIFGAYGQSYICIACCSVSKRLIV